MATIPIYHATIVPPVTEAMSTEYFENFLNTTMNSTSGELITIMNHGKLVLSWREGITLPPIPQGTLLTASLGIAADFGALADAAITGTGSIDGDVGSETGAIALTVTSTGTIYATGDPVVLDAMGILETVYGDVKTRPYDDLLSPGAYDFGGKTLTAGIQKVVGIGSMTTPLTLDGQDDPDAFFLIQIGGALNTTATTGNVILTRGAQSKNVFWVVEGAITTGASSHIEGTLFARDAFTSGASTTINGRLYSVFAAITLGASTTVTAPS
jgi:hypothetical protein|tara:strand:- start:260 stop:1069 length:810 start_codon:yes stop_codon:yes gene_type:complete